MYCIIYIQRYPPICPEINVIFTSNSDPLPDILSFLSVRRMSCVILSFHILWRVKILFIYYKCFRDPTVMMNNENDDNNKVELHLVKIPIGSQELEGNLHIPKTKSSQGIVIFAHGSGSSRHSQRNQHVAARLNDDGLATLLLDLLTSEEEKIDNQTREHRFDITLLSNRLVCAIDWVVANNPVTKGLTIWLFGASTGAATALVAAA